MRMNWNCYCSLCFPNSCLVFVLFFVFDVRSKACFLRMVCLYTHTRERESLSSVSFVRFKHFTFYKRKRWTDCAHIPTPIKWEEFHKHFRVAHKHTYRIHLHIHRHTTAVRACGDGMLWISLHKRKNKRRNWSVGERTSLSLIPLFVFCPKCFHVVSARLFFVSIFYIPFGILWQRTPHTHS